MSDIEKIEKKLKDRIPQPIGKHSFFSVAIPVCCCEEGLKLLFEVRAGNLKSQPGDICFPGGKIEEGETASQCVMREFEEETGIPASEVEIIGQFDTLHGFADYTVYTFVVKVTDEALKKAIVNKAEVEELFTVPLDFFSENKPKVYELDIVSDAEKFPYEETGISPSYKWRKGKNILPVYRWENRVIWGMTGRILKCFADKIL